MRLIFVRSRGHSRTFELSRKKGYALSIALSIFCLFSVTLVQHWIQESEAVNQDVFLDWQATLERQDDVVNQLQDRTSSQSASVALQLADLRSRLLRLESLGTDLVEISKLEESEFDFSVPVSVGGLARNELEEPSWGQLQQDIDNFSQLLDRRETELSILNSLLLEKNLMEESKLDGYPVDGGWTSSAYGQRIDPFKGVKAWHAGIDITSVNKESPVKALASGVVIFSGERQGYGKMVEIDHANGYRTRYAHHRELLVQEGTIINKGDPLGIMGDTGRSTGPHVHVEVLLNGKNVNPARFLVNN